MPTEVIIAAIMVGTMLAVVGSIIVGAAIAIAVQAQWRGYSLPLWLVAGIVIANPFIFLVLLALMPNRARKRLREQYREELDAKLAALPGGMKIAVAPTGMTSLAGTTLPERSLGDLPTMAPPERSLGDDVTRG